MGLNLLRLYCIADQRTLVDKSGQNFTVPGLYQGDTQGIEFKLLQTEAGSVVSGTPFGEILADSYTLKVGLFKTDGTQLAYQNSWTKTADTVYSGSLALNTAAITTAMGTSPNIPAVLEVEIVDTSGNTTTVYQQTITLYKEYISTATVSVPPSEVSASESFVKSYAMPRVLSAGEVIVLVSQNGTYGIELGVNDDGTLKANTILI